MKVKNGVKEQHRAGPAGKRQQIAELEASPIWHSSEPVSPLLPVIDTVLDNMSEAVILQDTNHRILWVNRAAARDMTPEEMVGRLCYEVIHRRQESCVGCPLEKVCKTGKPQEGEATTPDGRVWLKRISPVRDGKGKVIGAVEVNLEITERKRAEKALKKSEERYKTLVENINEVVFATDSEGYITYISPVIERITKYKVDEIVGKQFSHFVHSDDLPGLQAEFGRTLAGSLEPYEFRVVDKDGRIIHMRASGGPLVVEGQVAGITGSLTDISGQKQAEESLRKSEERLRIAAQSISDIIWQWDIASGKLEWYDGIDELLGYGEGEFPRTIEAWEKAIHPDDHDRVMAALERHLKNNGRYLEEYRVIRKDGSVRYWVDAGEAQRDKEGRPYQMIGAISDMTERKKAEEAVKRSEENLRAIMDCVQTGIVTIDKKTHEVTYANPAALKMIGGREEEVIGKICHEFICPAENGNCPITDLGQTLDRSERLLGTVDGDVIPILKAVTPVVLNGRELLLESFIDISELKRADEALRQAEAKYRSVVENAIEGIFQTTREGRFIMVNRALAQMHGYESPEEFVKTITDVRQLYVRLEDCAEFTNLIKNFGKVEAFEAQFYRKDGSKIWASLNARVVRAPSGAVLYYEGMVEDITERKEAEARLSKLYSMQRIEKGVAESLLRARNEFELFRQVCDLLMKLDFIRLVWIGLVDKQSYEVKEVAQAGFDNGFLSMAKATWDDSDCGRGATGTAIKTAKPFVMQDVENDPRYRPWREEMLKRGYLSSVTFPLIYEGEVIGVLNVYSGTKNAFGDDEVEFLTRVADDIAVGVKTLRLQKDLERSLERARSMLEGTIEAVVAVSETRDPYTAGHQRRVAKLASAIAEELGLSEDEIEAVHVAGLLHDIGKVYVPAEILSKPGKLNEIEMSLVKAHSQASVDILKTVDFPWHICSFVLQHHERMDGSGYPKGLSGDDISLEAKILGVADVVEAMASHRPYRPALGIDKALEEISRNKGVLYDPEVVDACLGLFTRKGFTFE